MSPDPAKFFFTRSASNEDDEVKQRERDPGKISFGTTESREGPSFIWH